MNIENLVSNLNGPEETDRLYAAQDLGEINDAAAVAGLTARVGKEPSRAVQEAIFGALAQIHDESVLQAAIELIATDDAFVRNEAVKLLGQRGAQAMPVLTKAVGSPDPDIRKFALDAMATIDSDLKENIYRNLLSDDDINLIITAVEYIGRDHKTALKQNVESVLEQSKHPMLTSACIEALSLIGDSESLHPIYCKLGCDDMSELQAQGFIRAVGRLGLDDHVDMLYWLIERFPKTLIDAAFDAIEAMRARVSLPQAPKALLAAVQGIVDEGTDPLRCYKAVRALGAFGDDAARQAVRQYLESQDSMVRLAAVESIADWETADSMDLLTRREAFETNEDVLAAIENAVHELARNAE